MIHRSQYEIEVSAGDILSAFRIATQVATKEGFRLVADRQQTTATDLDAVIDQASRNGKNSRVFVIVEVDE